MVTPYWMKFTRGTRRTGDRIAPARHFKKSVQSDPGTLSLACFCAIFRISVDKGIVLCASSRTIPRRALSRKVHYICTLSNI